MSKISPSEISELPPSILNTLPALQPPAGIKSNFVNPEDRGYILDTVSTILFCLMVCFFVNRVYTKLCIVRKAGWDDLTCAIGFLGSTAMYIVTLLSTISGPVGKHQWDVRFVDALSGNFVTGSAIIVFLSPITLLFTKLTFFLLYLQVFWLLRWLRISVYIGATLTCLFYGAVSIAQIVLLTPRGGETWLEHSASAESLKAQVLSIYLAAIGLGIDIALLVMPIAAVVGLKHKRKRGVLFVFFFGIFACVGSLLSIYYRVVNQRSPDITWNLMPVKLLALEELFVGISCACMPAFSRMLHHHLPALEEFRSILSSRFPRLIFWESSVANTDQRLYGHLEVEIQSPGGANAQPIYELGQLQSIQPFVGKGCQKELSYNEIHRTHELQQQ